MLPSTSPSARRLLGGAVCAVALGLAAACGGPAAPAAPTPAASSAGAGGHSMHQMEGMGGDGIELYAVQTGPLGVVVTDGQGRLVYGSDQDTNNPPTSHCTGACAQEWLPLVVPAGEEPDLLGVNANTVGRVTRDDGGSQLTISGWPVYVNRSDTGELKAPSPDAKGAWFVMTPDGQRKIV